MKRFLVLSDTHGRKNLFGLALAKAGEVDAVIHLGDNIRDALWIRDTGRTVYCVKGNCDFNDEADNEMLLHAAGKKILIAHGHTYSVKLTLDRLLYRGMEMGADAVFYGHTHVAHHEYIDGMLVLNPGSIAEPRLKKPSYAIVEIDAGCIRADLKLL